MALFETARKFRADADAVWSFVSWTGVEKLVGGNFFKEIRFHDRSPSIGAIRVTDFPEGPPVLERLEHWAEEDRYYRYRIVDSGPLPITDYLGSVRVTPAGPGNCILKLAHECLPVDTPEDEWRRQWLEIENEVFAYIASSVNGDV